MLLGSAGQIIFPQWPLASVSRCIKAQCSMFCKLYIAACPIKRITRGRWRITRRPVPWRLTQCLTWIGWNLCFQTQVSFIISTGPQEETGACLENMKYVSFLTRRLQYIWGRGRGSLRSCGVFSSKVFCVLQLFYKYLRQILQSQAFNGTNICVETVFPPLHSHYAPPPPLRDLWRMKPLPKWDKSGVSVQWHWPRERPPVQSPLFRPNYVNLDPKLPSIIYALNSMLFRAKISPVHFVCF